MSKRVVSAMSRINPSPLLHVKEEKMRTFTHYSRYYDSVKEVHKLIAISIVSKMACLDSVQLNTWKYVMMRSRLDIDYQSDKYTML